MILKIKRIIVISLVFFVSAAVFAQHLSTESHESAVTAIAVSTESRRSGNSFFSAGDDGFVIDWTENGMGEHYQLTDIAVKMIAKSPDRKEIAVYETDGGSINRLSVWDWKKFERKYAYRFSDSITSLNYSEKGNYIMVGTASVNGAVFINTSNGSVVKKINDSTGIVSLIQSSKSEKTCVMYSPVGNLTYYYLTTGKMRTQFKVEPRLSNLVLFNNNLFLAGIKDNTIYIIRAVTGKNIAVIPAQNPILLCGKNDKDLYYLEFNGRYYILKMIPNSDNKSVLNPVIVKTFKGPKNKSEIISCGAKIGNTIVLGAEDGSVYRINSDPDTNILSMYALTNNMYDKIFDMTPTGDDFYFLTRYAIYKSSYSSGVVDKKAKNTDQTNILNYNDTSVILWSKNIRHDVQLVDLTDGSKNTIFTPKKNIQMLRLFGNTLIDIEGNSTVNSIDISTGSVKQLYEGASLQDAVLYNPRDLYIAKSSATKPNSALIYVNTTTMETVPIKIDGNVAYSLCYDNTTVNSPIYGIILVSEGDSASTSLFSFQPSTRQTTAILKLSDEDPEAFAMLRYPLIYTNIGKNQIRSFNLTTKRSFLYKRSASLPLKVARNKNKVVVLNRDGSISWYNPNLSSVLSDWYLTVDGQWFAF